MKTQDTGLIPCFWNNPELQEINRLPLEFDITPFLNGLIFPDQTHKPVMEECKQIFASVSAAPSPYGRAFMNWYSICTKKAR